MHDDDPMDVPATLRAARRLRRLSQRELSAYAELPPSTLERIESGISDPRVSTLDRLLGAVGLALAVCTERGVLLQLDEELERLVDFAGRHFPAHCEAEGLGQRDYDEWWRWSRMQGVPTHTYRRRDPPEGETPWADVT
jgi:transcriptional regulator with XRE-family HTH domain